MLAVHYTPRFLASYQSNWSGSCQSRDYKHSFHSIKILLKKDTLTVAVYIPLGDYTVRYKWFHFAHYIWVIGTGYLPKYITELTSANLTDN